MSLAIKTSNISKKFERSSLFTMRALSLFGTEVMARYASSTKRQKMHGLLPSMNGPSLNGRKHLPEQYETLSRNTAQYPGISMMTYKPRMTA